MKIPQTPFSTRLSGSAKETELRLRSIFQWKKKCPPMVLFVLTALVVLLCFGLVSCEAGEASQGEQSSVLMPEKNGVLAVEEVPGGTVYATGRFRSADLYWLPSGSNIKNARVVRKNISNVDCSTLTLACEGGMLQLEYLQVDAPVDLDFNWDDMLKTIQYRITGEEPPFGYPQFTGLIDLDLGRNNMWITTRYRVTEDMPPEYIDSRGTVVE